MPCARTFNDLTRTDMAGTHVPEKWRAFADTMRDGLWTRRAAARVAMEHKTAWRFGHKVMVFLTPVEPPPLGGTVVRSLADTAETGLLVPLICTILINENAQSQPALTTARRRRRSWPQGRADGTELTRRSDGSGASTCCTGEESEGRPPADPHEKRGIAHSILGALPGEVKRGVGCPPPIR